jgi:hypothetical protein
MVTMRSAVDGEPSTTAFKYEKRLAVATLSQLNYFVFNTSEGPVVNMALPEGVEARMAIARCLKTLGFDTSRNNAQVSIKDHLQSTIADHIDHTGTFLSFGRSGVEMLTDANVSNPVLDAVTGRTPAGRSAAR